MAVYAMDTIRSAGYKLPSVVLITYLVNICGAVFAIVNNRRILEHPARFGAYYSATHRKEAILTMGEYSVSAYYKLHN
jgi:hypothetical protein